MQRKIILLLCALWIFNPAFCKEPLESLKQLVQGNKRYMKDELLHPNRSLERREEISKQQTPFATIVGCSDSRVTPEIIFDQGLGDLFIVRVAGNVVGAVELDSIEYSIHNLNSSLILVLGHESCGAVTAVMEGKTASIPEIASLIGPAVRGAKNVEDGVKANVRWIVAELKKNKSLKELIAKKKIDCVGAYYHLNTGYVEILR